MPIYSHSRLSTFEGCARKYWFNYIEKPDIERVETVEAFLGNRVHEALEELYERLQSGRLMSLEELLEAYEAAWNRQWSDEVRIVRGDSTADDYLEVGRESLRNYYAGHHPFDQDRTLCLEGKITVDLLGDGRYQLLGYVDRLSRRHDGVHEIHDYKTSRHVPTQEQADADRQLALYQIGVEAMWDDVNEIDLVWHYVRFGKELRSRRTPEQLDRLKAETADLIDEIESRQTHAAGFPPNPSWLCDWCEYRAVCPAVCGTDPGRTGRAGNGPANPCATGGKP